MKIGFIHEQYPCGGAEKVTSDIGVYLVKKNYKLYLFSYGINNVLLSEKDKQNFSFITINRDDLFKKKKENKLISEVNRLNLDVLIHIGGSLKIKRNNIIENTSCKHIYAHHGTPFWEFSDELQRLENNVKTRKLFLSRWKYKYFKIPLFKWKGKQKIINNYKNIYKQYNAVTVLCEAYKDEIINTLNIQNDNKINVIPNGLLPPEIEYSLDKRKQILYLGRMSYADKRIDRLIKIWRNIYKDFPDWEFILVGDGQERKNLEKLAKYYKLENIRFLGITDKPYEFYNTASILCMSSQFEGTPLVLTEAQQAGVIPIAFNCSAGVNELLSPSGVNGVLIPPFDMNLYEKELIKLMTNSNLRSEIQQNIIKKSEQYSMEKIWEKWHKFLQKINI